MRFRRSFALAVCLLAAFAVTRCTPKLKSASTLANQGILGLSSTNPYLGSNLFISQEAERSNYLLNFLKGRGAPAAIEIVEEQFSPPRFNMYYPRDKEMYIAELEQRDKFRQWIVRGPFAISRKIYRDVSNLETTGSDPVFRVFGREYRFGPEPTPTPRPVVVAMPTIPPPRPTATPRPKKPTPKFVATPGPAATPSARVEAKSDEFKPLNSDQQAILMSQGFAERADNGDLIHTVRTDKESFDEIVKWYTGSSIARGQIMDLNSIREDHVLTPGTRIRIPQKLAKELKAMPLPAASSITTKAPTAPAATSVPASHDTVQNIAHETEHHESALGAKHDSSAHDAGHSEASHGGAGHDEKHEAAPHH